MKLSTWRLRGAIGAVSLVIVGFLLGIVTDRLVIAHHAPEVRVTPSDDHAAMVAFQHVLELDNEQLSAIHEILMQNQASVDEAWESLRAGMSVEVENAHNEIRKLLTDEQMALFEAWLDRHVRGGPAADRTLLWSH